MENNQQQTENNQGGYNQTGYNQPVIPAGIKKWNWGAFAFSFYWGIGNQVYISLLCLVPFVNVVMIFILGAKGNEWAWQQGKYRDVEEFQRVQSTWNRAGLIAAIIMLAIVVIYIIFIAVFGIALLTQAVTDPYSYSTTY